MALLRGISTVLFQLAVAEPSPHLRNCRRRLKVKALSIRCLAKQHFECHWTGGDTSKQTCIVYAPVLCKHP